MKQRRERLSSGIRTGSISRHIFKVWQLTTRTLSLFFTNYNVCYCLFWINAPFKKWSISRYSIHFEIKRKGLTFLAFFDTNWRYFIEVTQQHCLVFSFSFADCAADFPQFKGGLKIWKILWMLVKHWTSIVMALEEATVTVSLKILLTTVNPSILSLILGSPTIGSVV